MTQDIVFTAAALAFAIGAFQLGRQQSWTFARKLRRFNIDLEEWEMEIAPERERAPSTPPPLESPQPEAGPARADWPSRVLGLR